MEKTDMKKIRTLVMTVLTIGILLAAHTAVFAAGKPYFPSQIKAYYVEGMLPQQYILDGVKSTKAITKLKSSNKKVATAKIVKAYNGEVAVQIIFKRVGTTTVSFKLKRGERIYSYKSKVLSMKYSNPFKSFTIGKKDIKAKLDKSPKCKVRINTTKKQLLSIKLKKGWTLSMLTLNRGDNMKDIKNNTKLNFKKSRIIAFLEDKEGLGVTCYVDCVE